MFINLVNSEWFPVTYISILGIALLLGVWLSHKLRFIDHIEDWKSQSLMTPIISFFSLLLAFTLSSSANSSKDRTSYMQQHQGALADLYRESFLYDDSLKNAVKAYIVKALTYKIAIGEHSKQEKLTLERKSTLYSSQFQRSMSLIAKNHPKIHIGAAAISGKMENIIDLDNKVYFSEEGRTPTMVMALLLIGSWIVGFMMGLAGVFYKKQYYLGPIAFMILTALTVVIIQDMDNPHSGLIRPPYDLYKKLLAELKEDQV